MGSCSCSEHPKTVHSTSFCIPRSGAKEAMMNLPRLARKSAEHHSARLHHQRPLLICAQRILRARA